MELNDLRKRTSFIGGDNKNIPTPGKMCIFKLSKKYMERHNCPYLTKYVIGEVEERKSKLHLAVFIPMAQRYAQSNPSKIYSTYNEDFVDYWVYLDNIDKLCLPK